MPRLACLVLLALVACTPASRGDRGDDTSDTPGPGGGTTQCPEAKACGARTCGNDPVCGLSCGTCTGGLVCQSGQCQAPSTDPNCASDTPCVGDSDCVSGSRCNHARCQRLFCGASGTGCAADYFCAQGLSCVGGVCQSPSSTGGGLSGSVEGHGLSPKSRIFGELGFGNWSYVALSDDADACQHLSEHRTAPSSSALLLVLVGVSGPGTYPVRNDYASGSVFAGFGASDSQCRSLTSPPGDQASSGTVQVTSFVPGSSAKGSFDLHFGSNSDRLTGSFDAVYCSAQAAQDGELTCSPSP